MDRAYWHKQTAEEPLFSDLLWSRPQNRRQAGKLLIIGGNAHGFAAAGEAYQTAISAGIGTARVLLPDSLQKTVGKVFAAGEYALSTPSGSFNRTALAEALAMANWAEGVLIAGDLGRNAETSIFIEQFLQKYDGPLTVTKDGVDYFLKAAGQLLERPDTLLVLSFAQLQKLAGGARYPTAFTFSMDLLRLVETLHDFTARFPAAVIVRHLETVLVGRGGEVSTTQLPGQDTWRVATAATAAVWWLQHVNKPFEALTTALVAKGADD